jgi:hypothetical protein
VSPAQSTPQETHRLLLSLVAARYHRLSNPRRYGGVGHRPACRARALPDTNRPAGRNAQLAACGETSWRAPYGGSIQNPANNVQVLGAECVSLTTRAAVHDVSPLGMVARSPDGISRAQDLQ